jgi:hypothetical protein
MHLRHVVAAGILAVTIPLAGCATMAQQQFQTMRTGLASTNANLEACVAGERARPEFAPLQPHLPALKGRLYPTAAQLADVTYPTADEAQLLAQFTTSVAGCENAYRASVAALLPSAAPANDRLVADIDGVFAEWIGRKVTWGEGAQQINQIYAQDEPAVQAAATATMDSLKAAHQQELAQRRERVRAVGQAVRAVGQALKNAGDEMSPHYSGYCDGQVNGSGNFRAYCY